MNPTALERSLQQYRELDQLGVAIEQAVQANTTENMPALCDALSALHQAIEAQAGDLHICLRAHKHEVQSQVRELKSLMQQIEDRNQRIIPRIQGILAVQRKEMAQLKIGLETARGYASNQVLRTGSVVNRSS